MLESLSEGKIRWISEVDGGRELCGRKDGEESVVGVSDVWKARKRARKAKENWEGLHISRMW